MDNSEKCGNWRDFWRVSDAILHAFRKVLSEGTLQESSSFECDTIRGKNLENSLRLEINILYWVE